MAKVEMNQEAPQIELEDFSGKVVRLVDFKGKKNVLLVFNRGFT
jgi:peroxiredoxin